MLQRSHITNSASFRGKQTETKINPPERSWTGVFTNNLCMTASDSWKVVAGHRMVVAAALQSVGNGFLTPQVWVTERQRSEDDVWCAATRGPRRFNDLERGIIDKDWRAIDHLREMLESDGAHTGPPRSSASNLFLHPPLLAALSVSRQEGEGNVR